MSDILSRITNKIGDKNIVDKLSALSKSDLNSLLLEVFDRQANTLTATDILKSYQLNRFTIPSGIDPEEIHALESKLLRKAFNMDIKTIMLSPSAPLGSCSVFGSVDQYNVVSALRGTETLADPSNMLAIIIADKLKRKEENNTIPIHMATTARVIRAQNFVGKGLYSHFGLYCMVSSGIDTGSYTCEKMLLEKHLNYYKDILSEIENVRSLLFYAKETDTKIMTDFSTEWLKLSNLFFLI